MTENPFNNAVTQATAVLNQLRERSEATIAPAAVFGQRSLMSGTPSASPSAVGMQPFSSTLAPWARAVTAELFAAYSQEPDLMEESWEARLPNEEPARSRHIADYIAGMTDRYAVKEHRRLFLVGDE